MPVSHSLRCIFVHVPKCAGTSISDALAREGGHLDFNGPASREQITRFREQWLHHIPAKRLRCELAEPIWNSYFKFGFVRNPWERVVSLYHFEAKTHRRGDVDDFESWLERRFGTQVGRKRGASYYLTDERGGLMVDYVGRCETVAADFDHICTRLGIAVQPLPVLNASEHLQYRSYFSERAKARVRHLFSHDIELFGYTF